MAIIFGLLLGMALLLGILVFRSRRGQRQRQQRPRDHVTDVDREDKLWLKPYVDLQAYEDPAQGALDFTQELDPAWLVVDTVIGEGEFFLLCAAHSQSSVWQHGAAAGPSSGLPGEPRVPS